MRRPRPSMRPTRGTIRVIAVLLAACSFPTHAAPLPEQMPALKPAHGVAAGPRSHAVLIQDFKYQPGVVTVSVGDVVEWKNADIVPHTASAENMGFDSGSIGPGRSWKLVARKMGAFDYICAFHPNMKGKLIVQAQAAN